MSPSSSPYSAGSFVELITNNFAVIFLVGLFFIFGFLGGSLWTENQYLRNGGTGNTNTVAQAPTVDPGAPTGPTQEQLKTVPPMSDEDYVRGNRDANVVLYEYS